MELTNEFRVDVPVEQAWGLLTDIERIAPCMPGAQLTEVEGDEYRGLVKVKVGPITAQYRGTAEFVERDESAKRAVVRAEGRETRGQGNARATVTAQLAPDGDGTRVEVSTDLTITGKVAQFGRGVLADVSTKLLGQFADNLSSTLVGPGGDAAGAPAGQAGDGPARDAGGAGAPGGAAETDAASGPRRIESPEAAPVDLLGTAGAPVARRLVPLVAVLVVAWLVVRALRRRGSGRRRD